VYNITIDNTSETYVYQVWCW